MGSPGVCGGLKRGGPSGHGVPRPGKCSGAVWASFLVGVRSGANDDRRVWCVLLRRLGEAHDEPGTHDAA